jgi:molybdenum cofactor cytidylyltransferase
VTARIDACINARDRRRVAAVILAGGLSRRMGSNKLLEVVNGKPMIASVVDAMLAAGASPVVVVTGHQAELVREALKDRPVTFAHNPDFIQGMSTTLRRGIEALPDDIDAAVVSLGDMPFLTGDHISRLIDAFAPDKGRPICVPAFQGQRGNPILWGRIFFDELRQVQGDMGAREVVKRHANAGHLVAMDDDAVLRDVDTPDVLKAARGE